MGNVKFFTGYLRKIWEEQKPLAVLFKTDSSYYLYDTGTNKILKCDSLTYDLLEKLFYEDFEPAVGAFLKKNGEDGFVKTVSTLKKSIENQDLFVLYEVTNADLFPGKEELQETISTMSNELSLEVTEECNLRCIYCVHNDDNRENRNHGSGNMNIETAIAAIDFLKKNSEKSHQVAIGFYGGEPFINFPVIKKSIEYAKKTFPDKKVEFSVTSNGTLLTPGIARFLFENNINVTVSIDGKEAVHDRYRKNLSGSGSYKKTVTGLRTLFKEYGARFKDKISLYSVYAPPFSLEQIRDRTNLWEELDWLPHDIRANIVYYSGPRIPGVSHSEDTDLLQWAFENYINSKKEETQPHPYAVSMIEKLLTVFSQRPVYKKAIDKFPLHGCCLPAQRRIFVTVSGDFRICEKIPGSAPTIGNVKEGVNFDILYDKYLKEYKDMSLQVCKKCWAINICESCFIDGFDENGLSYDKKMERCESKRLAAGKKMYYFCKALEMMPGIQDYFAATKLK